MMSDTKGSHLLLILWTLTNLVSCSHAPSESARPPMNSQRPVADSPSPMTNVPPAKSDRVITIHALDNEYHGSTAVLPNSRPDHQKGTHD